MVFKEQVSQEHLEPLRRLESETKRYKGLQGESKVLDKNFTKLIEIFNQANSSSIDDRDIIGARNIMFRGMYSLTKSVHWNEIVPLGECYYV